MHRDLDDDRKLLGDSFERRRGYATALTGHTLREARALGHSQVILQASTMGRGVYERLGFEERCRLGIYAWRP